MIRQDDVVQGLAFAMPSACMKGGTRSRKVLGAATSLPRLFKDLTSASPCIWALCQRMSICLAATYPVATLTLSKTSHSPTMISNLGLHTIVLSWMFTLISITTVGLHVLHRLHVACSFGIDDGLLLGASLATLGLVIMITWAITDEGLDKHLKEDSSSMLASISHVSC